MILFEADVERFCVATLETVPDRVRDVVIETVPNRAVPDPFQNRAMSDHVTFKYFVPCRVASSIMLSFPYQTAPCQFLLENRVDMVREHHCSMFKAMRGVEPC